jgi:hypothetical protein
MFGENEARVETQSVPHPKMVKGCRLYINIKSKSKSNEYHTQTLSQIRSVEHQGQITKQLNKSGYLKE